MGATTSGLGFRDYGMRAYRAWGLQVLGCIGPRAYRVEGL